MRIIMAAAILALLAGCATVSSPNIEPVKSTQPDVSPALQQPASAPVVKRKVAIGRFTNESKYGQSIFINDEVKERLGKQAVDILSAKLVQTDKFIILERSDLDKIQKELNIGKKEPYRNMANYLIIGSITEFGRKNEGQVGVFSRTNRQVVFAKVHVRLVDVSTGELVYAEEAAGEAYSEAGTVMGLGSRAGYDTTLNDKAIEAAITNLASNIIENLLEKPWKGYILDKQDDLYIISGGKSQNIFIGDEFDVMIEGKTIENKQTGMNITLPGKKIATIKVLSSSGQNNNEVSFAQISSGVIDPTVKYENIYIQEKGK